MVDEATKKTLAAIPLCATRAGPRDGEQWVTRLKEEYTSLIKVCKHCYCFLVIEFPVHKCVYTWLV